MPSADAGTVHEEGTRNHEGSLGHMLRAQKLSVASLALMKREPPRA
jgi:hypothetical protein